VIAYYCGLVADILLQVGAGAPVAKAKRHGPGERGKQGITKNAKEWERS